MKKLLIVVCMTFILGEAMANDKVTSALGQYAWKKRQLIVFSPHAEHDQYQLFIDTLSKVRSEFEERKLHSWHVVADNKVMLNSVVKNDVNNQDFRDAYEIDKNEFQLLLIGFDQGEKLRQQSVNIDFIFSEIDQMPMRMQEIQDSLSN